MKHLPRIFLAFSFAVLLLCLSLPALAIQLRGDWESSGAPPTIYEPKYKYAYRCQIQMTDSRLYNIAGRESVVYAAAEFEMNNQVILLNERDLNWELARFSEEVNEDGDMKTELLPLERIPFSIEKTSVRLSLSKAASKKLPDTVTITLNAAIKFPLPTGNEYVSQRASRNFTREDQTLGARTSIYSSAESPTEGRSIKAAVYCEKRN